MIMFSRERIERLDAAYGIPRKANEQYLPSYNAFWHWAGDIGKGAFFIMLGVIGAVLSLFAGWLFSEPGLVKGARIGFQGDFNPAGKAGQLLQPGQNLLQGGRGKQAWRAATKKDRFNATPPDTGQGQRQVFEQRIDKGRFR